MCVRLLSLCVFLCGFYGVNSNPIMIASLLPSDKSRLFSSMRVAPAISIAVEKVTNSTGPLPGRQIIVNYADSKCSIADAMNEAINYYVKKQVHVFFGPCCDYAAAPIARQTRYWDIPMVTTGAMARDFALMKPRMFPLLTRVGTNFNSLVNFIVTILKKFNWSRVKLLYEPDGHNHVLERFCHIATDGIHYGLRHQKDVRNLSQEYFKFDYINDILTNLATEVGNNYAVVVLCASPQAVREIMIKAHELNFDNGEYVFFNIDLFSSKNDSERPWYNEDDDEERNNKARIAYEALMTVTLRKPTSPEYKIFSTEVKRRAKEMYENFTYGEEEVNSFVGAFHDAVILYALALNETLAANISITNGTEITKRMWNRTFEGITGTVSIDQNGDRNADYSLLDLNPETDTFEVVANYYGNKKQYEPVEHKTIHWAGGRNSPPPDTPDCGFDGSKCPPDEPFPEYGIVIIVLGSIILIVLVAAFFIYRHKRDKTYEEVAKAFRLPESSVKRRVSNMRVEYSRKNIPEISRGLVHSNEDMSESDSASVTMFNKPLDRSIGVTTRKDDTLIQAVNNDDCYGQHVASEMREIDDVDIKKMAKGQIDVILAKARRSALGVSTDA